jgi:CheY-like chemotaxis protein
MGSFMKNYQLTSLISIIYTFFINSFKSKEVEKNIDSSLDVKKTIQESKRIDNYEDSEEFSKDDKFPRFSGINALVVEDNPINKKMIMLTLKTIGVPSDMAENGKVAYEMYTKNSYDIILMDIQMPVMDGVESTHAILEYEKKHNLTHTPIVAVTANALIGDRERFLAEGMDEYISKPIDLYTFVSILKTFFPTKLLKVNSKIDILLYKETHIERKIVDAILKKLGYSVLVVDNINNLKIEIDLDSCSHILIDRVKSDTVHRSISQKIESKNR